MNKILQEAFNEGRNTTVAFEDSEACKNQKRLETVVRTDKRFTAKTVLAKGTVLHMVDDQRKDVKTFKKFSSAAFHVSRRMFNGEVTIGEAYTAINLSLYSGIKAFGYNWRIGKPRKVKVKVTRVRVNKYVIYSGWTVRKLCASIPEVAKYLKCSAVTVQRMLITGKTNNVATRATRLSVEVINNTPKTIVCKDKHELRKILNVTIGMVDDFLKEGGTRNNKTYIIQESGNGK